MCLLRCFLIPPVCLSSFPWIGQKTLWFTAISLVWILPSKQKFDSTGSLRVAKHTNISQQCHSLMTNHSNIWGYEGQGIQCGALSKACQINSHIWMHINIIIETIWGGWGGMFWWEEAPETIKSPNQMLFFLKELPYGVSLAIEQWVRYHLTCFNPPSLIWQMTLFYIMLSR